METQQIKHPTRPDFVRPEKTFPFGKHFGKKMSEVPASYLMWAWENAVSAQRWTSVYLYIKNNMDAIKERLHEEKVKQNQYLTH